ncbi:hypothetical protein BGW36DRAFT_391539 [Talaromyces proteolyticus]|uniref:2EXR domain-containing protein n=1 Tax=Talaromyces proteolyticus TaxID=1131652 RepID=A0AAD4KDH9_9EURO|nr:uncharacterized protein BGW36DRAFT_391539 [Talaromyces proteolyticus]KAH8688986.1 hypothetical protein BGW36DRAFT_391539 [Talaromyces proteolyticus]
MFHLFSDLPAELRLYIWSLSLADIEPIISISCERGVLPNSHRFARLFRASRNNPPQLSVNQEARQETLLSYHPYFSTQHAPDSRIYLAPDRDIVRLPDAILGYLGVPEQRGISRLIVEVSDYMVFGHYWMDSLKEMSNLADLTLTVTLNLPAYTISNELAEAAGLNDVQTNSVAILKEAFIEGIRDNPGWKIPNIKVASVTGQEFGEIKIKPGDMEN